VNLRRLVRWSGGAAGQALVRLAYPYGSRRRIRRGTLRGHKIVVAPAMGFTFLWNLDAEMWSWMPLVKPGSTVYDVGANSGQSTLHLAEAVGRAGRVVALEPMPQAFRRMAENVRSNGLTQVTLVEAAASDEDGVAEFALDVDDPTLGRLGGGKTWDLPIHTASIQVKVLRLDSWQKLGWPPPDFLKIDVEGGAGAVLAGARDILSTVRPPIYIELHDKPEQAAVKEALEFHHYRATALTDGTVEDLTSRWASPLYCEPL
jgi:FkbM family methyltransferase